MTIVTHAEQHDVRNRVELGCEEQFVGVCSDVRIPERRIGSEQVRRNMIE